MKRWKIQLTILTVLKLSLIVWGLTIMTDETQQTDLSSKTSKLKKKRKANKRSSELGQVFSIREKSKKELNVLMSDPIMSQKWGLEKSDARNAWQVSQGSRDIVVAVIDTGIDVHHEDLRKNLWTNPGETGVDAKGRNKATNGIDDDGNGFVDDVHGWNFVSNNNSLKDNHGHGTHIAGIVGAEGGNGKGISGVAPNVSLMVLKYYDPKVSGTDNLLNTIKAIRYATQMNAHIINYSGGGLEYNKKEYLAIKKAADKGILFVAAAGNEKSNSDNHKYYPADYDLKNIISVTAINPSTKVLPSSNFGVITVDLAAPGENILSTLPKNQYGYMTGTSQATSFVSGGAALLMAQNPSFKAEGLKKYLLKTGDRLATLKGKTQTSRKLNLFKALTTIDREVGLNGVVAANVKHFRSGTFSYSNTVNTSFVNPNEMVNFGRNLLQKVQGRKVP